MDYGPLDHHQDTCVNCGISRILRSRFNRTFGDSWSDTWTHLDSPMKIGQAKKSGDVRSWPTDFAQSWPSDLLHQIGRPAFFN